MSLVSIHKLGGLGIVRDTPFHELPPHAWTDGQNVRFYQGAVESFLGHATIQSPTNIQPLHLEFVNNSDTQAFVYLSNTKATVLTGGGETDITRPSADYNATVDTPWSSCFLSGTPIFNNLGDAPQVWTQSSPSTPLSDLANFPSTLRFKVLRSFKNFLVGLHSIKSGTEHPHMVKWSDVADPGAVPPSWDETVATNLAGEQDLADSPGVMLDCLPLGDINMLYKQDAVWSMTFVGGIAVFAFRKVFHEFGALATNCVVDIGRRHVVLTQNDLILHDGASWRSVLSERWKDELFSTMNTNEASKSFLFVNRPYKEVWVCYPTGSATYPDRALVWNWETGVFGLRTLPGVSRIVAGVVELVDNTWDSDSATWDSDGEVWNAVQLNLNLKPILAQVVTTNALHAADQGNTFAGSTKTSRVERVGIALDGGRTLSGEPRVDLGTIKFVRAIYPRLEASDTTKVKFYVGVQDVVDGAVTWNGPYTVDQTTGFKIDLTLSARLIGLRVESTDDTFWRLWGFDLDIEAVSRF